VAGIGTIKNELQKDVLKPVQFPILMCGADNRQPIMKYLLSDRHQLT
jgi:hypothetical protein